MKIIKLLNNLFKKIKSLFFHVEKSTITVIPKEPTQYRFIGGEHDGEVLAIDEVLAIASGTTPDMTELRECGIIYPLNRQPVVQGYSEPLPYRQADGTEVIAYESYDIYDIEPEVKILYKNPYAYTERY